MEGNFSSCATVTIMLLINLAWSRFRSYELLHSHCYKQGQGLGDINDIKFKHCLTKAESHDQSYL